MNNISFDTEKLKDTPKVVTEIPKKRYSSPQQKKTCIISRREIEPLLTKAGQVLMHYCNAVSCQAEVVDQNGLTVNTSKLKFKMRICEFCNKQSTCEKMHYEAQMESQRINGTFIYTCELGFIYWTSPLYRNERYAGALTAGQVLPDRPEIDVEKFRSGCKGSLAAEKIKKMLDNIPLKSHEQIQAMARLLGVCAEKISKNSEDSGEMINHLGWLEEHPKDPDQYSPIRRKKSQPPSKTHTGELAELPDDSEYPLEKERMLLAAFRRGDNETGRRILNEIMDNIRYAIPLNFEIVRFRAIELVVLLSRAAVAAEDSDCNSMFDTNNRYLRRLLESKTPEELIENLYLVTERMSGKIFSFQGIRHASVLRKAERYIWENYTRKISLDEISRASGLSAPYFSTIFKEEMGENLSSYINRLRVEKAATLLTETGKALNEIAALCGFEDQSWFSKIFKNYTCISPGKYRENGSRSLEWKPERINFSRGIIFPEPATEEQNEQDLLIS